MHIWNVKISREAEIIPSRYSQMVVIWINTEIAECDECSISSCWPLFHGLIGKSKQPICFLSASIPSSFGLK